MSNFNQPGSEAAYIHVQSENVFYNHPPPPPYSVTVTTVPAVTAVTQPPIHGTVIIQPPVRTNPTHYTCHSCQKRVITKVVYVNTRKTHMTAGFICGFTIWCCLCCLAAIPYAIPTFKRAEHYCPNCNVLIGTYSA